MIAKYFLRSLSSKLLMIIALQGIKNSNFILLGRITFNVIKIQSYFKFHPACNTWNYSNSEPQFQIFYHPITHFQPRAIHILTPTNCATVNLLPVEHPKSHSHPKTSLHRWRRDSIPRAQHEGMKKETPSHSRLIAVERSHVAAHICL